MRHAPGFPKGFSNLAPPRQSRPHSPTSAAGIRVRFPLSVTIRAKKTASPNEFHKYH